MSTMLTTNELQQLINVDRSTIYRMAESGAVPAVKVGRQWRFPVAEIETWLSRRLPTVPSRAAEPATDLTALLPPAALQGMVDLIAELFGVMAVVTDMHGRPLASIAKPCGFYAAIAAEPGAFERCVAGWGDMAGETDLRPRFRPSELGFLCAHAYIRVERRLAGIVMLGGLAPEPWPPPPAELASIATRLDVPIALLERHVDEVYRIDVAQHAPILDALQRFGDVLSRFAHERSSLVARLGEIATLAAPSNQRSLA